MKLTGYFEDNEDVLLLNSQYIRPEYDSNTHKEIKKGTLYLTYRDNKTKEKKLRKVSDPKSDTFFTKNELRDNFNTQRLYMDLEDVDRKTVPYCKIIPTIKNEIKNDGRDLEYLTIAQTEKRELFKWRHTYFADYDVRDYSYISYVNNHYNKSNFYKVSKAYFDIETDIYGLTNTEFENGEAPINALSLVITANEKGELLKHPKVFTLLLRNHLRYEQQEYFEKHIDKFIKECHDEFDNNYNTPQFIIKLFDDELVLLKNLFALLHYNKPDFIHVWNMSFDVPYIMKRLVALGENPEDYFCHQDFEDKVCKYNYDLIYKNDFKNKVESFECSSYSLWTDQMLNYAGVRKSIGDYGGNSLDNIAKIVLNSQKRVYDGKDVSVLNAAIREYWNFVKYSINDTLLQYGIEERVRDTDTLFNQAIFGGTRFVKALKQSVYLKNVYAIEFFKRNIVPRNNINNNYSNSDELSSLDDIALAGALVGDPVLNTANGLKILGAVSSCLFKFVIDFDFSSMYPNIKITCNISPNTQWGRIIISMQIIDNENPTNEKKFMRGGKFIEDYEIKSYTFMGAWLKLPNVEDTINKFGKYMSKMNKKAKKIHRKDVAVKITRKCV